MNDIYYAFHEYFEIVEANSEEMLREVYKLRYQVFCVEQKIFDAKNYPDELERDEYDWRSKSILLKHRPSNCYVGTVRLIHEDISSQDSKFPVEKNLSFDSDLIDIGNLPRQFAVEISRFAILKRFSGRRYNVGDVGAWSKFSDKNIAERRRFPHIGLALVVGIVRMCAVHNFHYWLSAMDPCLNRLLSYYGSNLYPVGPLKDYYGTRRPYFIKLIDVLKRMYLYHHDIWELVTDFGKYCPYSMSYAQARMPAKPSRQDMLINGYVHR